MGKISFTIVLFLCLSFMTFAQTNQCPKIKIGSDNSRDYINVGQSLQASATFENQNEMPDSKFNWIVIKVKEDVKENEVIRIKEKKSVEISTSGFKLDEGGTIILVLEVTDPNCSSLVSQKVPIAPSRGFHPLTMDQYGEMDWNDEKIAYSIWFNI